MSDGTIKIAAVGRLKHADLHAAARKIGGEGALARHLGIQQPVLNRWINLHDVPPATLDDLRRRKSWTPERLADFERKLFELTGKTLVEMFPADLRRSRDFLKAPKRFAKERALRPSQLLDYSERMRERLETAHPHANAELSEVKEIVLGVLATLPPRDQHVLRLRFGLDGPEQTLEECSAAIGLTKARIGQIERKALNRIRQSRRAERLQSYIDAPAHDSTA